MRLAMPGTRADRRPSSALQQAATAAFPGTSSTERRMAPDARDLPSLVLLLPNGENLVTSTDGAYATLASVSGKGSWRFRPGAVRRDAEPLPHYDDAAHVGMHRADVVIGSRAAKRIFELLAAVEPR